jgi:hypothetical protein
VARRFGRWAHAGGRPATGSERAENCKKQLLNKNCLKTARKLLKNGSRNCFKLREAHFKQFCISFEAVF